MKTHLALKMYLERKKRTSPGFSMRSLARRLEISPSFLSRALSGKKPMPNDLREKLAVALDVEPELLDQKKREQVTSAVEDWTLAEHDSLKILRNWYYIPLLELTTLENSDGTSSMIARRLGLSVEATEIALREMKGLGLLQEVDGKLVKTEAKVRFTSSKASRMFQKYHDDMLEKAQQELRRGLGEDEFQKRLITTITISANAEAVQAAKTKLAACLHEIANDLAATPGTEVYQLSAQLFPLTKD